MSEVIVSWRSFLSSCYSSFRGDCIVMLTDLIFDLRRHDKYIKHMRFWLAIVGEICLGLQEASCKSEDG